MKRTVLVVLAFAALVVGFRVFVPNGDDARNTPAPPVEQPIAADQVTAPPEHNDAVKSWAVEPVVANSTPTNWLIWLRSNECPHLTAEQAEAYLAVNKRSAESLLAAYRTTRDKAYLKEAMEKFPDDPMVNFNGYFDALFWNKADYTTEERRALLERFAKSAPENSLPDFLAAADYFKSGESDQALAQFRNAATKASLQDYSLQFVQNAEEAYRHAGYSDADAKAIANTTLLLPHLSELKRSGVELLELAGRYQQSGAVDQAQESRELALHLAGLLEDGSQQKFLINQLVGIAIERMALNVLDPNSAYDHSGRTVQTRIEELKQTRKNLNANVAPMENLLPNMTSADQSAFFDRVRIYGEAAAMKWAVGKYSN